MTAANLAHSLTQASGNRSIIEITPELSNSLKPATSRLAIALALTTIAALAAFLVIYFAASPVGFIASTLSISTLAAKSILGAAIGTALIGLNILGYKLLSEKERQKVMFELSAMHRLLNEKNHDMISLEGLILDGTGEQARSAALFLGALPNKLQFEQGLQDLGKNGAVFSINEEFELAPLGLSCPYTADDWQDLGIAYSGMIADDHALLTPQQMDFAADKIHEWVKQGKRIYVHCRGGVGRSATVIAAYLMKYGRGLNREKLSLEEICALIKKHRPGATIFNKIPALLAYDQYLGVTNRPTSFNFDELIKEAGAHPKNKVSKKSAKEAFERGRISLYFPFGPDPTLKEN